METWDEMKKDGFFTIDQCHRIAVKSLSDQDNAAEIVKEILMKSYIDYLIQQRKEEV